MPHTITKQEFIDAIKKMFIQDIALHIDDQTIDREQGNRFFTTLFEQADLVARIHKEMTDYESRDLEYFCGFDVANSDGEFRSFISDQDYATVKHHSTYDDFSIHIIDEFVPRDACNSFKIVFLPFQNISETL